MPETKEDQDKIIWRQTLSCNACYGYLMKLNKGQFTIAQLSQHYSRKYRNIQWHIYKLLKAELIDTVNIGGQKAGRWQRHLYMTSQKGKLALLEKGDINE